MTLYHASTYKFNPSDLVDPAFSKKGVAYATTDPVFAVLAASKQYKLRKTLAEGQELAADEQIYLYEVVPLDWTEDLSDPTREHYAVSRKGFVVVRLLGQ